MPRCDISLRKHVVRLDGFSGLTVASESPYAPLPGWRGVLDTCSVRARVCVGATLTELCIVPVNSVPPQTDCERVRSFSFVRSSQEKIHVLLHNPNPVAGTVFIPFIFCKHYATLLPGRRHLKIV